MRYVQQCRLDEIAIIATITMCACAFIMTHLIFGALCIFRSAFRSAFLRSGFHSCPIATALQMHCLETDWMTSSFFFLRLRQHQLRYLQKYRLTDPIQARLDTTKLDKAVDFYFRKGLANSTQRTYLSAKKRCIQFCLKHEFVPLPVSAQQLCQYTAWLANQGLTHRTSKTYLAAARHLQIAEGLPDPKIASMPKLDQVMRGIKSHQARTTAGSQPRLPITPDIPMKRRRVWESDSRNPDNVMLWAAACTCFFGFFRAGEITVPSEGAYDAGTHLNFADVAVDDPRNPTLMHIRLKSSQTDPFRNGVDICLGRTKN